MRRDLRSLVLIPLIGGFGLVAVADVVAVKETAMLTIDGPGLPQPVVVKDAQVLALSNVFAGMFIGALASEPDAASPRYTVTFDVQTREGVKKAAYVVTYSKERWTGAGFVYLPGRGDGAYRRNIGTILRDGQDGRWHEASKAWSAAINARLP
jgi:hypothetical protein